MLLDWWRKRQAQIASTYMPDVTPEDIRKMTKVERYYMEKANQYCWKRGIEEREFRRVPRYYGPMLFAGVVCIYLYTIYTIKQETFLDIDDDPKAK